MLIGRIIRLLSIISSSFIPLWGTNTPDGFLVRFHHIKSLITFKNSPNQAPSCQLFLHMPSRNQALSLHEARPCRRRSRGCRSGPSVRFNTSKAHDGCHWAGAWPQKTNGDRYVQPYCLLTEKQGNVCIYIHRISISIKTFMRVTCIYIYTKNNI